MSKRPGNSVGRDLDNGMSRARVPVWLHFLVARLHFTPNVGPSRNVRSKTIVFCLEFENIFWLRGVYITGGKCNLWGETVLAAR